MSRIIEPSSKNDADECDKRQLEASTTVLVVPLVKEAYFANAAKVQELVPGAIGELLGAAPHWRSYYRRSFHAKNPDPLALTLRLTINAAGEITDAKSGPQNEADSRLLAAIDDRLKACQLMKQPCSQTDLRLSLRFEP